MGATSSACHIDLGILFVCFFTRNGAVSVYMLVYAWKNSKESWRYLKRHTIGSTMNHHAFLWL